MSEQDTFEKYLLSRTLWWQEVLDEMSADAVLSVINAVEAAQREVASQLEADALGLVQLEDWQRAQDNAFNAWADEVLAGAKAAVTGTISEAFIATATASLAAYNAILSLDGRATNIQTVGLSTEQIRSWFQDTPLGNAGLETWVDKAFDNGVKQKLLAALRESGVLGEGTADAVARVMRAASDAGFQITERDAISLTRTFIQTANINAQEVVYAANESLFKGYRRIETLDTRTCLSCALADGSEYGLDEERPKLPAHPRCRGLWLPLCKSWRDFGFDVNDLEEVARPWTIREQGPIGVGGRKIENYGKTTENFEGWWRSLPADDKARTSIGPVRRKLLESGQVNWADMWDKATGRPKTLAELGFDREGNRL